MPELPAEVRAPLEGVADARVATVPPSGGPHSFPLLS
jgi:hypothetical protein